jgi:hypothetical protein
MNQDPIYKLIGIIVKSSGAIGQVRDNKHKILCALVCFKLPLVRTVEDNGHVCPKMEDRLRLRLRLRLSLFLRTDGLDIPCDIPTHLAPTTQKGK